jgi:hypothetical protein
MNARDTDAVAERFFPDARMVRAVLGGDEITVCTWAEFRVENDGMRETGELRDVEEALIDGRQYVGGGGAAPSFTVDAARGDDGSFWVTGGGCPPSVHATRDAAVAEARERAGRHGMPDRILVTFHEAGGDALAVAAVKPDGEVVRHNEAQFWGAV